MAKNTLKLCSKLKMADFLLVLADTPKRLFKFWNDTAVCQISNISAKFKGGGVDFENC